MTTDELDDDEPLACGSCSGTGMSTSGPPDVGRCWRCRGTGIAPVDRDEDDVRDDAAEQPS